MSDALRMPPADPHEAAAWWHAVFEAGGDTAEDRARFDAWLAAHPSHRAAYNAVDLAWEGITAAAADPALLAMREEALGIARRRGSWGERFAAVAAVFAVVVFGAVAAVEFDVFPEGGTFETAIGERSTVTLADGSRVTLNTNTRLTPLFDGKVRRVVLEQGQAYFEVAKDPHHPFIVEAAGQRVRAIGTAFDVRVDGAGQAMQVTLVEGRVTVEPVAPSPAAMRATLEPGDQFVAKAQLAPAKVRANVDRVTSWREGRLIFDDMSLADAVKEVNRYSRAQIVLGDPRLRSLRVSGVFDAGRNTSFVEGVTGAYGVRVAKRSEDEIVLMLRE
jgi:transmembrane sensor